MAQCYDIKTLADYGDVFCEKKSSSVVGLTSNLCGVLHIGVFGGDSVPLQVFQFEASLPFIAIWSFEKYNFTTTHVCKLVIDLHDIDPRREHLAGGLYSKELLSAMYVVAPGEISPSHPRVARHA
jgi:hypothetical protein